MRENCDDHIIRIKTRENSVNITLGKKYKDKVHGFEGVATAKTEYLNGCNRVLLEKMSGDDIKEIWFDSPQIEGIVDKKPGGGHNPPSRH